MVSLDNDEVTITISGSLPLFCIIYYNYFKWKYLKGEKERIKNLEKFKVTGKNVESPIHQSVSVKDLYPER